MEDARSDESIADSVNDVQPGCKIKVRDKICIIGL